MARPSAKLTFDQPTQYRLSIQGRLDKSWPDDLGGLEIRPIPESPYHDVTTLTGELTDQAVLFGMLNALYGLGLPLLSVERMAE